MSSIITIGESVYCCSGSRIEIRSLQGVVKNSISFPETDGVPLTLSSNAEWLVCSTSTNMIKLYNVARREPKTVVPGRVFTQEETGVGMQAQQQQQQPGDAKSQRAGTIQIKHLQVNANGTRIGIISSIITDAAPSQQQQHDPSQQQQPPLSSSTPTASTPNPRYYVYDVELDRLFTYSFSPDNLWFPTRQFWDASEHKLVAVEVRKMEVSVEEAKKEREKVKKLQKKKNSSENKKEKEEEKRPEGEKEPSGQENAAEDEEEEDDSPTDSQPQSKVTTLFATSDYGILMQDSFPIDSETEALAGINVPYILFAEKTASSQEKQQDDDDDDDEDDQRNNNANGPPLRRRVMRDFVGLEDVNEEVKKDLLSFSYYLTIGNMDEAYRSVKKISSLSIWENMCTMAVKTHRLDVAQVCLGNMSNARGAAALRTAMKSEPEKEAQVAMLAIQLGLNDDAERLYKECGRYDLLIQFYIAGGRWKDALKIAASNCRILLKSTHYQYARYLEHLGDTNQAIKNYEKSSTAQYEIPRMLFDQQKIGDLEAYIKGNTDKTLLKWWAQYCESNGEYDEALKYYSLAKETLALVRIHCFRGEDAIAAKICAESNDLSACYHLARQYEQQDNPSRITEAIEYYKLARRYNHAVRLAKEYHLSTELLNLALESSSPQIKLEAAEYFEEKGELEKAVLLYQKGGKVAKALDLCFKGELFDSLAQITENLNTSDLSTDPSLLNKCGDYFLSHNEYEKSVGLYITAKQYLKALTLCMKHNIKITEAMAEKMTPPKTKDEQEKKQREDFLKKLAHSCKDQGEYHLACKKYTQAGDYVRAMKCLLKTTDTEKITSYATMTKQKEIYILAANYLQNLDWHNDPEIMKRIITFYTQARAMLQLSVFYDACAQVEIDEYRDYEKALGALQDSQKFIIKGKDIPERETKLVSLDTRIRLVQKFVDARKNVKGNPEEMVRICYDILDTPDVESAIRVGDVYALLIEYFHSVADYNSAYQVIERMRGANIILSPYLDQAMVQRIHQEVGAPMVAEGGAGQAAAEKQQHHTQHQQQQHGGDGGDEVGEEIDEDL